MALVFLDELGHFDLFFALLGETSAAGRVGCLLCLVDHLANHFGVVFEGLARVVGLQVDLRTGHLFLEVGRVLSHVLFLVAKQLRDVVLVVVRLFTRIHGVLHLFLLEEHVRVYVEHLSGAETVQRMDFIFFRHGLPLLHNHLYLLAVLRWASVFTFVSI